MATGTLYDGAYIQRVPSPYTPAQVKTYLKKIGWQTEYTEEDSLDTFEANLDNLATLTIRHLLTFPVDNTDLHYTPEHHMPTTPIGLYERLVLGKKGSFCFGHNPLLLHMLRGLGYRAFLAPGRVLTPHRTSTVPGDLEYTPLVHIVILVQLHEGPQANITYMIDVGFGGVGPVRPILLAEATEDVPQKTGQDGEWAAGWVWGTYPPERHRLVRGAFAGSLETQPGNGIAPSRDWHLQVTHTPGKGPLVWRTLFTITDKMEFTQWDLDAATYVVSTIHKRFAAHIVCLRPYQIPLEDEEAVGDGADAEAAKGLVWYGKWTMDGAKATKRIGGQVLEEKVFTSEVERLTYIRDVFKIGVSLDDAQWIVGRAAAIPQPAKAVPVKSLNGHNGSANVNGTNGVVAVSGK